MNYININRIGENFWYQPSIITISKRKWQGRPYKNLKKLLIVEKLFEKELVVRFNGDKDLRLFHMLQQYKELKFSIQKKQIKNLENRKIEKFLISKVGPLIFMDRRSLIALKKGFLPFYTKKYINAEYKKIDKIIWRKSGWKIYKEKIQ